MNNCIQEIMDLEHVKTLTPIQEQVLNRKNKNRDIIKQIIAKINKIAINKKSLKLKIALKNIVTITMATSKPVLVENSIARFVFFILIVKKSLL